MNAKFKKIYQKIFPPWETENILKLKKELSDSDIVLDLGCGPNSWIQFAEVQYSVGVELFEPYIQKSKKNEIHDEYIHSDILKINFEPDSFDVVICIDVIEHLTKKEGIDLINKMEIWAKKKVIIFTPNGYVSQEEYHTNHLQKHKSGWTSHELDELGFKLYGYGWKQLIGPKWECKYKPKMFWVVVSDITRKIPYYFLNLSFAIFAVKTIK